MASTTEELVEQVLGAMDKIGSGEEQVEPEDLTPPAPVVEPDAHTIPEKIVLRPNGQEYHVRKLGIHDDVALIRHCRGRRLSPLLTGEPGTGKTALLEAAFTEGGFETIQGTGDTEVADFVGSYVPISATEFEWQDGPLLKAMDRGVPLYVDEIALIDPKVMALPYGVMDGRDEIIVTANPARGTVKAKEGFFIIAACNPNAPGARMSEALLSRFSIQFAVRTDYKLAKKLGVNDKVVRAAENLATKLKANEVGWAPQLRELLVFRDVEKEFGKEIALRNLVGCSPEIDRATVADVITKATGTETRALELG